MDHPPLVTTSHGRRPCDPSHWADRAGPASLRFEEESNDVRVAVIGCGDRGAAQLGALLVMLPANDLVVVDRRAEAAWGLADQQPGVLPRTSVAGAIADVDAVVVAAPLASRPSLASEAIAAGRHVLVVGPLAPTSAEAARLVEAADRAEVVLAAGHANLHEDGVRRLARLVAGGRLGRVHHLDGASVGLGPYRRDVNVVWDRATDDIAISNLLLETTPDSVTAWGDANTAGFAEDVANLRLVYRDLGVVSTIRASWLDPEDLRRTTVVGSEKMVVRDDLDPASTIRVFDRGRRLRVRLGADQPTGVHYREGGVEVPYVPRRDPLVVQARAFLRACQTGAQPAVDGRFGVGVVAVLEAATRSLLLEGAEVAVEPPELGRARPVAA